MAAVKFQILLTSYEASMVAAAWNLSNCDVIAAKPGDAVAIACFYQLPFRLVAVFANAKLSITVISPTKHFCVVFSLCLYVYYDLRAGLFSVVTFNLFAFRFIPLVVFNIVSSLLIFFAKLEGRWLDGCWSILTH
jgi:hypothetical protein